jgi:hypothetical protein
MSNKNKLHDYFMAKSTSSHETCDTHQITTMDKDITSANEVTVLCEIDGNSLTSSSSSIVTSFESQNQESENLNHDDRLITTISATKDNHESLSDSSRVNSFKRDPGRRSEAAREFLLLGLYQPITTFPTVNHRHFCLNWYKVYNWVEFSEMNKNAWLREKFFIVTKNKNIY